MTTKSANLRKQWEEVKKSVTEQDISEIEAISQLHGLNISTTGYMFCKMQMAEANLQGIPYVDAKTYDGWKRSGFKVVPKQKSFGYGITWVTVEKEKGEKSIYPKRYAMFHKSQVEPIKE